MVLYLVMSHSNAPQVARLARRLSAPHDGVVRIHHDPSGCAFPAELLRGCGRASLLGAPRRARWGRFSQVRAMLKAITAVLDERLPFDWLVLLSGQDYPTRHVSSFHDFLAASPVDGYLDYVDAVTSNVDENATRYFYRYYQLPAASEPFAARLWRINALQPYVRLRSSRAGAFFGVPDPQPFSHHLRCFRGSFWWTLSRGCVEYLRRYTRDHPDFVSSYQAKLHPDESFVQSILVNAGRFRLANDDLRYIRWDRPLSGSPALLRAADFDSLIAAGKPHARKFDERVDGAILDRLDRELLGFEPERALRP